MQPDPAGESALAARLAAAARTETTPEELWALLCAPTTQAGTTPETQAALASARRSVRRALVERLERAPDAEEERFLHRALTRAHDRFEALQRLDAGQPAERLAAAAALSADLMWLRSRLDEVTDDPDDDALSDIAADVDWCGKAVRHLGAAPPSERPAAPTLAALDDQAAVAAVAVLRQRMADLEELLAASRDHNRHELDFPTVWRSFIIASDLETEIHTLAAAHPQLLRDEVQWVAEHRVGIRAAALARLVELPVDKRRAAFRQVSGDLVDRTEETLVAVDESPPDLAVARLKDIEYELDWGLEHLAAVEPAAARPRSWLTYLPFVRRRRDELQQRYQGLRRARRRVINESVEKTIASRMERLFGRRLTAAFESLLLVLIVAFLVLMYAESKLAARPGPRLEAEEQAMTRSARNLADAITGFGVSLSDGGEDLAIETLRGYGRLGSLAAAAAGGLGTPSEALIGASLEGILAARALADAQEQERRERERIDWWLACFAYADLAICLVFLLEFFTKLTLSPRRGNFFRRHFLIDLLPSIPFGFISHLLVQGLAPGVSAARGVRALRLVSVPRVVRYVRVLRPMVRMFRVLTFAIRGTDRLVRRYSGLINRPVIFFEPTPDTHPELRTRERFIDLHGRVTRRYRGLLRELPADERAGSLAERLDELHEHMPFRRSLHSRHAGSPHSGADQTRAPLAYSPAAAAPREIPVERLLTAMVGMDATTAEDMLGREMVMRLDRIVGLLSVPGIRRLPVLRDMIKGLDRLDPYELVAQALRVLGRFGEGLLARVYSFADLYGIVTAPQLLDRVGGTLVKALGRPAKRLILFGLLFLIFKMFLNIFESGFLQSISNFFGKILSTAFLVLGVLCLLPLTFGMWLRRIAGEASDFYERAVEAQFLTLLRGSKAVSRDQDLALLHERVLAPEQQLIGNDCAAVPAPAAAQVPSLRQRFDSCLSHEVPLHPDASPGDSPDGPPSPFAHHWVDEDRVLQLYRDYLEGTPLTRSDVKVANLLLGNLDMDNIHRERLRLSKRELKKLERLDLARERSLFGPHMWFNFITEGIAQRTAKLLVDYNQHCLPLADQHAASPEERERFRRWLAEREVRRESDEELPEQSLEVEDRRDKTRPAYVTTVFNALHFVTAEPERDRMVGLMFGSEVLAQLQKDRAHIFRSVFGSYPLPMLPRARRTANPYRLYMENVAGGHAFLLPLKLAWLWLKLWGWALRGLYRNVREILDPTFTSRDPRAHYAGYEVAKRKIARMRKPIFLAAMSTRARFDPEYLGFAIPMAGQPPSPTAAPFRADLERIEALDDERRVFEDLCHDRGRRYQWFLEELEQRGILGSPETLCAALRALGGTALAARPTESLRAMMIAYLLDYRDAATLCRAEAEARRVFGAAIHGGAGGEECREGVSGSATDRSIWQQLRDKLRGHNRLFQQWWAGSPFAGRPPEDRSLALAAYARDEGGIRRTLKILAAAGGGEAARAHGWKILTDAALRPGSWSEQLVTVRTVQTLTILDLECYHRLVKKLGDY